jgi:hypothetical protein
MVVNMRGIAITCSSKTRKMKIHGGGAAASLDREQVKFLMKNCKELLEGDWL